MISLQQVELDLAAAIKARDQLAADTLRGLKARIQNEKTAKGRPEHSEGSGAGAADLTESEIIALVRSEVKKRKEAAESYEQGARLELADKELKESAILEKYLPQQMSEKQLSEIIVQALSGNSYTAKDFGQVMGKLKASVGDKADGASLAKLLKEKLK